MEVIGDLAMPLPVTVIAEMLGVPASDYTKFKYWSDRVIEAAQHSSRHADAEGDYHRAGGSARCTSPPQSKNDCRIRPNHSRSGALITAQEEKEALSADEVLVFVILLLVAGNETTTNLIGNGMLALGRNPRLAEICPEQFRDGAESDQEMLRYDGPVQSTGRHPGPKSRSAAPRSSRAWW